MDAQNLLLNRILNEIPNSIMSDVGVRAIWAYIRKDNALEDNQ